MNSDKILDILTSTSEYVSGQSLAQTLGVSRQAVWKEINALRERGYEIESVPNRGYRLSATPAFPDAHAAPLLSGESLYSNNYITDRPEKG